MTRSFGTTKQSPSPQHHSPAALRWSPRLIQLSWAKVSGMTKARPAKTSANRARLPNIGLRPFRFRCPGPAADQVTHPEDKIRAYLVLGCCHVSPPGAGSMSLLPRPKEGLNESL